MESILNRLFDFQRFAKNEELQRVIDSVHEECAELSFDDLEGVSAAGDLFLEENDPDETDGTT